MDLFETLQKKQKINAGFNFGAENRFFLNHFALLNTFPAYKSYYRAQKPFDILRANIILRGIMNKKIIDEAYASAVREVKSKPGEFTPIDKHEITLAVEKAKESLDCFMMGDTPIYVPILPRSLNAIFAKNPLALGEFPLKSIRGEGLKVVAIDPFDTYGYEVFDSDFTNLILVKKTPASAAFFDYDSLCIYVINNQGRCDVTIALFDKYLGKRNTNHMMERIIPVVDAYYRDDREAMINYLVQNQLISSRLIYQIKSDEDKHSAAISRLAGDE